MYEVGGATSFCTLKLALLFVLGATVGGFVLATEIDSRLLCPGTPSNVTFADSAASAVDSLGFGGTFWPNLNDAARDILGATTGGAVDATGMASARLCPGTFKKVSARRSLVTGTRLGESMTIPARRAAALDMRGTMSGWTCVEGRGRALKRTFPLKLFRSVVPVAFDAA